MTTRKISLFAIVSALALTSLLFTCAEVEPFCGTGEIYDPSCEFCYGSRAYPKCKNGKYNPLTAGCDKDTLIGTRCSNDSIVPLGTPCGGYTLIFASAPELGGRLEPLTPPDNGLTYDAKQTVLLQASANPDYKFAGWAGAQPAERFKDESTVTAEYVTSGNMPKVTIVAMFKPVGKGKLITDVFPKSPASGGSISRNKPEPEDGYKDGEQVVVTAHPAEGFAFAGWSGADSSRNISVTVTMDESKTLVAMFTPILYSLKVNTSPAGGGAVFIDGTPFSGGAYQDVGTKIITVWAKENQGYEFTRWSGIHARFDDETSAATTVTLDADAEITAIFKSGGGGGLSSSGGPALLCTLKVNITPKDGGSVLLDPPSGICRLGEYVTATVMPNEGEGYTFAEWSGDTSSAANQVTVYMGRNKTLIANFQNNETVNPPSGGGQTAPDTAKVPFRVNVDATVNAERASGGSSSSKPAPLSVRGGSVDTMRIPLQGSGGESWKIGVSAAGYVDTIYMLNVVKGVNSLQNITLRQQTTIPPPPDEGADTVVTEVPATKDIDVTFYDFHSDRSNPEFEQPHVGGLKKDMVQDTLDRDEKPLAKLGAATDNAMNRGIRFWFRDWSKLNSGTYAMASVTEEGHGYLEKFRPIYMYANKGSSDFNLKPPEIKQRFTNVGNYNDYTGEFQRPFIYVGNAYKDTTINGYKYSVDTAYTNKVINGTLTFNRVGTSRIYEFSTNAFFPLSHPNGVGGNQLSLNPERTEPNEPYRVVGVSAPAGFPPVSGEYWNSGDNDSRNTSHKAKNFSYTMEMKTSFQYKKDDNLVFNFRGDDDVWLFIGPEDGSKPKRLVKSVDIGGIHEKEDGSVVLNNIATDFGLVDTKAYDMHLFYCERHSDQSNILIQTNIIANQITIGPH